ncbi:MAG: hypothetical protein JNJ49_07070 [Bdellovibrionaceae bacterium]|nr:hypothetical protein [Pseudobdellovibrionaceae bacterium]
MPSLWQALFPRSKMRWEWDDSADSRVVQLWHLRREIAESQKVIYSKWYRDRATVFSMPCFRALYRVLEPARQALSADAREILELLEYESPLSTKQLRRGVGLQGKENEKRFHAATRELWRSLAMVGIGEIDDGAFPSLAHAATHTVFEDQAARAGRLSVQDAWEQLAEWPELVRATRKILGVNSGMKA